MVKDSRIKIDLPNEIKNSLVRLSTKTGNSQASLVRTAVIELIEKYRKEGLIE